MRLPRAIAQAGGNMIDRIFVTCRTDFSAMERPLARVGEWRSIAILHDASRGPARFGAFQKSLGVARDMPARRLAPPQS